MKKVELFKKIAEAKEKYSAFKKKPITWGDYIRYAEVCMGISAAIIAAELVHFKVVEYNNEKALDNMVKMNRENMEKHSFTFGDTGYADEEEVEEI